MPTRPFSSPLPPDDRVPGTSPLCIDIVRPDPSTLVVTPIGEADVCTVAPLRHALNEVTETGGSRVLVDLDHLAFLDASTLGVLVEARERLSSVGGVLTVRCHDRRHRKLLRLTGLDGLLDLTS